MVNALYPFTGHFLPLEGGRLHYLDEGAGHPVVMLHGASSNLEAMRRPLGDLLARDHRIILIDRPGHGWSTRARRQDSTRGRPSRSSPS